MKPVVDVRLVELYDWVPIPGEMRQDYRKVETRVEFLREGETIWEKGFTVGEDRKSYSKPENQGK